MRSGRLTRALIRITILNCALCFVVWPTVTMLAARGLQDWQIAVVQTVGGCATILLPVQCAVLWRLLRPVWSAQRDRRRAQRRITAILSSPDLQIAFQPVLSTTTGRIIAVEALARFPQAPQRRPDEWFAEADEVGLGVDLELLALRRALVEARNLSDHLDVAINLSPCALNDPRSREMLLQSGLRPSRLIIEITEHCVVTDYELLRRSGAELRSHGIRLAIDDAGSGYASLQHIVRLSPDLIKLDRSIISGLDTDPARRALVKHLIGFRRRMLRPNCRRRRGNPGGDGLRHDVAGRPGPGLLRRSPHHRPASLGHLGAGVS